MKTPKPQTPHKDTPRDIVCRGLAEVNDLKFFGKLADDKSEKKIRKAIENIEKDEWFHPNNKRRVKLKLENGLNILKQQSVSKPEVEPEAENVKKDIEKKSLTDTTFKPKTETTYVRKTGEPIKLKQSQLIL